nr:hypothetical protein [Tanacetum cinerariifolium]
MEKTSDNTDALLNHKDSIEDTTPVEEQGGSTVQPNSVVGVAEVLIVGYEHVVMNYSSSGNKYLHSPLTFPAIKQLAIKWWDEYGFVIHP